MTANAAVSTPPGRARTTGPVVVAYELEPASRAALRFAADAAAARATTLTVVHTLEGLEVPDRFGRRPATGGRYDTALVTVTDDVRASAEIRVNLAVIVVERPLLDELQARAERAEMVVLGVHPRPAVVSRLIDSAPQAMVTRTPAPVVVVPASAPAVRRIVVGFDGSPAAVSAAAWAVAEGRRRALPVTAVRVVGRRAGPVAGGWDGLRGLGGIGETVVSHGDPAVVLGRFAAPDAMLVVGRHARGLDHRHSVVRALAARAEQVLAVVPEGWTG